MIDVLAPIVEQKHIPHYLLVMFWAAHGNATPVNTIWLILSWLVWSFLQVAYWTICHIFSEAEHYKAAMKDVEHIRLYNVQAITSLSNIHNCTQMVNLFQLKRMS